MIKQFSVTKYAKFFVAISLIVILAGVIGLFTKGFVYGIDFSGGTILTLNMGKTFSDKDVEPVRVIVDKYIKGDKLVSVSGDTKAEIRFQDKDLNDAEKMSIRTNIINDLKATYPDVAMDTMDSVGATAGREMQTNALLSVAVACALILVYIAFRFEYIFGVAAIISLLHDVLIMAAVMIFTGTQLNSSFIAAMLTIVGYSINDTIVLFDRIRENVKVMRGSTRQHIVDVSFLETLVRTLNTSITVFITLVALYILGVQSIKEFALPLIAGVVSGTYSSILIAAPLWMWIHDAVDRRKNKKGPSGAKKPAKAKA